MSNVLGLLAVVVLVLANGFFVATEFALVSVRRTRIETLVADGNTRARSALDALDHLDAYIAATQFGITMASLALGWIGEPALSHLIEPLIGALPFFSSEARSAASHTVSAIIAFSVITALHIVLGELAPKSLALQRAEATSLWVARPIHWFLALFRPVIMVLNSVGNAVVRLAGIQPAAGHALVQSAEELKLSIAASREAGLVSEAAQDIVEGAFSFTALAARQVMVPRTEVATIEATATIYEFLELFRSTGHTRFPVLGERGVDDVQGMISAKELLVRIADGAVRYEDPIAVLVRPAFFVPDSKRVSDLLLQMQKEHARMAVLLDEYGGMAGIVTQEDIVEEIFGELDDELDRSDDEIQTIDEHTTIVEGSLRVEEANEQLSLQLPEGDYETIAGLILDRLGHLPQEGEHIEIDGVALTVLEVQGPRITRIEILRD